MHVHEKITEAWSEFHGPAKIDDSGDRYQSWMRLKGHSLCAFGANFLFLAVFLRMDYRGKTGYQRQSFRP
jgi:hypothetical protein